MPPSEWEEQQQRATRRLVAGGAAGAIEKILGGQEWLERVSKECQQEEFVVEKQQVVEEGLCCLRASGRSSNNKGVGGRRSYKCYREAREEGRSGWSGYRRSIGTRHACGGETAGGAGGPLLPPSEWEEQQQQGGLWQEELQVL